VKYWIALLGGFSLAIIFHRLLETTPSNVVVYTALPGVIVHLLITGGHGGTIMEERFGAVLEVGVNTVFYATLLRGITMLLHKVRPSKISN
jgi:hypothetical protein